MVRGRDWDIRWLFLDRCRTRWLRRPPPSTVSTPVSVEPTAPQRTPRRPPLSRTGLHAHLVRCQNQILDRLLLCSAPGVVAEPCRLRLRRCVLRHRDQMVPLPVACVRRVRLRTAADVRGLCRTQALDLQLGHSSYATPPCHGRPLHARAISRRAATRPVAGRATAAATRATASGSTAAVWLHVTANSGSNGCIRLHMHGHLRAFWQDRHDRQYAAWR